MMAHLYISQMLKLQGEEKKKAASFKIYAGRVVYVLWYLLFVGLTWGVILFSQKIHCICIELSQILYECMSAYNRGVLQAQKAC